MLPFLERVIARLKGRRGEPLAELATKERVTRVPGQSQGVLLAIVLDHREKKTAEATGFRSKLSLKTYQFNQAARKPDPQLIRPALRPPMPRCRST